MNWRQDTTKVSEALSVKNSMYSPKYARNSDNEAIKEFIDQNGFAILVSLAENKLWATHIPLLLSDDGTKLTGHISRANKQWKNFSENAEVLAIFNGPHAYISSSWYNHENVPTWNYIAVHVYGNIRAIEGEELYNSLKHLTAKYEKHSKNPVAVERMSQEYVQREMQGLIGFEITITSIEAAYKLSQNRDKENYQAIINQLENRNDFHSHQVADEMKKNESFR